jgi:hypothetical protein
VTRDETPAEPAPGSAAPGSPTDAHASGRPRGRAMPKTEATPGLTCELCGGPVLDRHCKVVCLNCGFQRDCSDP